MYVIFSTRPQDGVFAYHMRSVGPEQVSRAGVSNYNSQYLWDVISCPCPWYLRFWHNVPDRVSLVIKTGTGNQNEGIQIRRLQVVGLYWEINGGHQIQWAIFRQPNVAGCWNFAWFYKQKPMVQNKMDKILIKSLHNTTPDFVSVSISFQD